MKVLLVDDHGATRTEIRHILTEHPNVEVIGEAADGFQALLLADQLKPDIVILDVRLPRMDGISAARIITSEKLCPCVVGLSSLSDPSTEQAMLAAGASAFLSKSEAPTKLYETLLEALGKDGPTGPTSTSP